jgi:hypothetical protein
VEKISIPISLMSPSLFSSLNMVCFLFGKEGSNDLGGACVGESGFVGKGVSFVGLGFGLQIVLRVTIFCFLSSTFLGICNKKLGFLLEHMVR